MRAHWLLSAVLLSGCATQRHATRSRTQAETPPPAAVPANPATRLVETRYEMRAYHDASDPLVRHEAHAVYRATRVPVLADGRADTLATVPRTTMQPATHLPLPNSAEVQAELVTQKQITSDLRNIQATMTTTQKAAEQKFGELVNQTAETIKLRRELEEERARVKRLETSLRERETTPVTTPAATVATDMKW